MVGYDIGFQYLVFTIKNAGIIVLHKCEVAQHFEKYLVETVVL